MRINLKKILCPVDFSATSDHAIMYAVTLAESFEAGLILLHVLDIPSEAVCHWYGCPGLQRGLAAVPPYTDMPAEDGQQEALEEAFEDKAADEGAEALDGPDECRDREYGDDGLEELAARLGEGHGCEITTRLREGQPFVEIVTVARDEDADLIVMGTHGRTGLAHMLIGSTAEKVVRMAPCPVLTVKHPEHEFVLP